MTTRHLCCGNCYLAKTLEEIVSLLYMKLHCETKRLVAFYTVVAVITSGQKE